MRDPCKTTDSGDNGVESNNGSSQKNGVVTEQKAIGPRVGI